MGCQSSKDGSEPIKVGDDKTTAVGTHLAKPEDVVDFPTFPEGTKSLLSKHLSRQIWNQLKDKKDKYGFTFREAIFSGAKNSDSRIGCYAGSHDSYKTFAPFFDKIVEDYHQHGKDAKHVSNMNAKELVAPPLPEDEAAMIVSTRIRVGRNLADFPLGPALTKAQRLEVMTKVTKALETFEGDLAGKFYPLQGMDKETQTKLIEDHFLFK